MTLDERVAMLKDAVRIAMLEDAVRICLRELRECVVLELAPSAWWTLDGSILLDPPLEGPRWEGLPGTHPMISRLHNALSNRGHETS